MQPSRTLVATLALLAWVLAAGLADSAQAQVNPFGRSLGGTFTEADLALLEEGSKKLRADDVKVGTETSWNNEASGNRGRSKVIDMPTLNGLPCRKIVHQVYIKGRSDPSYASVITCRTASGEWRNAY